MYIKGINKIYGFFLKKTYNFYFSGRNLKISPNSKIEKKAAIFIYLGDDVLIKEGVWINVPYQFMISSNNGFVIKINSGTAVGERCFFTALHCIDIGSNVLFGPGVFVADHSHEFSDNTVPIMHQGVTLPGRVVIEDGCWLGYHSVVIANKGREVRIGRNSVVGANAVVTKSFPEGSVLVGNPARNIK